MDRLQAMQTFVRVVERGSFSAVARETGVSQSTISKQVAALEAALKARLLLRSTRSLALTEEGEAYFTQARRLVAEVAEAESALRRGQRELTGWLRVAAAVGFGRLKLLPLVQSFLATHPAVKIDLKLHDGYVDLIEQGVDVAVRTGDQPDSSLVMRRIGTTRRLLVAHKDYLRRLPRGTRVPREPDDLLRHNCLVYTELRMRNAWTFIAGAGAGAPVGTERIVRVQGNLQSDSSEVIRAAVLSGMGLAYTPEWLFEAELARGRVVVPMPAWQTPPVPMQLVYPATRQHSAKVQAFGDHVAANLTSGAPCVHSRRR